MNAPRLMAASAKSRADFARVPTIAKHVFIASPSISVLAVYIMAYNTDYTIAKVKTLYQIPTEVKTHFRQEIHHSRQRI